MMNGNGIIFFIDDRVYLGSWINNKMHGYGEFYWPDGRKYRGYYKDDKKDGFGIFYWSNPKKAYIGLWKDGKQNGVGYLVNRVSLVYGRWKEGINVKYYNRPSLALRNLEEDEKKYINCFKYDLSEALTFIKFDD